MASSAQQLICITDTKGKYNYVNPAFALALGLESAQISEESQESYFHQEMPKRILNEINRTLKQQ